jgi:type IV pilus assembly protein PilM
MNSLGIYFGPSSISIVESKGRLPVNNIHIPRSAISKGELSDDKVPDEIKMAPYLKEEFKKNKIENTDIRVSLSGRDLIIRNFAMPILPRQELSNAVNFEVKKYIPFKVEDLVSDFQLYTDKFGRKSYVLFVGIKKETLDR